MAKPTRPGAYTNENIDGWLWSEAIGDWIDLTGLMNLDFSGLGSGLGTIDIDKDAIRKGVKESMGLTYGEITPLQDGQVIGIGNSFGTITLPDFTPTPVPPLNFPLKINLKSVPSHKKGFIFTDSGQSVPAPGGIFSANAKDFLSSKQIGAKSSIKAKEVYTLKTLVNGNQYNVQALLNGRVVGTASPSRPGLNLVFNYPQEIVIPDPPSQDVKVTLQYEFPAGVSATVNLGGKTTTIKDSGQTDIVNVDPKTLDVNPTSNSSYNHVYTLYNASGTKVAATNTPKFTFGKLVAKSNYKLRIAVSKGEIPKDPPADPQPPASPTYRYEKYIVTEKRTSGESAPGYTKPSLELTDGGLYTFNIGEGGNTSVEVPFTTRNTDWVNVRTKNGVRKNNFNTKLVLKESDFNGPGAYQVWLQPDSNINGTGEAKAVAINVIQKDFLPGPDITRIEFPETILGEDYKGYNIDFGVNWESVNTNYIDVFIGKVSNTTRILKGGPAIGSQQFNIGKILKQAGESLQDVAGYVYFDLYFIPYNEEGDELTKGITESIKIAFDKGDILLRRPEVMRDISDAICENFDSSALAQDNSKFLTHLMHFGDGDNKLIATWCTDYEEFSQYEDVIQKVENDEGEYVDQIVRKKTNEEETLVFKMYEPLPRSVQPNEQIWVSKIQSIPLIEQVTLVNEELKDCIELRPDFGQGVCGENIGFQIYDELVSSGSATTTSLLSQFVSGSGFSLKNLDIQYVSSSKEISGSLIIDSTTSWGWDNFVKYSSAEERVNNFLYKIKLLEFYDEKVEQLQSGSFYTGSVRMQKEIESNKISKQKLIDNLDGFESFLYTSSSIDGLTYPGAGQASISASTSNDAVNWYSGIIDSAQNYDYYNKDFLVNNLPQHVIDDQEGPEFITFFNMMGHHFDVLWSYTKSIAEKKNLEHKYSSGIRDGLLSQMLKSLGWDAKMGANAQALWQYAFGTTEDGTSVNSMTGKDRQNEVWRRLLNNLPYLMKHKGSSRAVKAALACYGVPSSMLTIMEFGGPRNGDGGVTKYSFEDRTAAINISGSESILIPWKEYTETVDHPNSVEIRLNTEERQTQTFISSSGWNVGVVYPGTGTQGKVEFQYLSGSTILSQSSELMPFFNEEYTQIVVQHLGTGSFEVFAKEAFNERIRNAVSMSINNVPTSSWELDNQLTIGGSTFTGSVDEFRYWTTALSESRIDNHTLMPDAIDGNHHSSSTEDLILRLDFEYPKDRNADTSIKNVSINETYDVDFVTASNFDSNSTYPYHYTTYERTVTANVPSSGFNVGNKFRFEVQEALSPTENITNGLSLSYRERSTKKSFDTAPIDSNKLGLFFSPIKEINNDILKSIGQFELDEYIGDPNDRYNHEYTELKKLRNYYFERYTINLYEYIQLVRYIDQSLFETLETLVPARAITSSGLLIEPHILERSKVEHKKPTAIDVLAKIKQPTINLRDTVKIRPQNIKRQDTRVNLFDRFKFKTDARRINPGILRRFTPRFTFNRSQYNGILRSVGPTFVSSVDLQDGRITDTLKIQQLLRQFDVRGGQSQIGIDPRNLRNGLAGILARNGVANITRLDGNGRLIKERKQVWIVTEQYTEKERQAIPGTGQKTADGKRWFKEPLYRLVDVTKTRKIVVFNEIGDPAPSGDNILSAVAANSNGGRLPGSNLGDKYGKRGFKSPSIQTSRTTLDGRSPVETFCTNPNILKVSDTARGKGEPILEVDKK